MIIIFDIGFVNLCLFLAVCAQDTTEYCSPTDDDCLRQLLKEINANMLAIRTRVEANCYSQPSNDIEDNSVNDLGTYDGDCQLTHDSSCFVLVRPGMTWYAARQNCASQGGRLAEITSAQLNTLVKGMWSEEIWLGASDEDREGQWMWMTSDRPVTYTDWAPGEPSIRGVRGDEHCLLGNFQGGWNDAPCGDIAVLLCEFAKR